MNALTLPETLDQITAPELSKTLLAHRGTDIVLDASPLQRLSAIGLEMLIAARKQWEADGARIEIRDWSDAAMTAMGRIGATPDMLQSGAEQ